MKIVLSASGANLRAATSPIFGRAPYLVFVDTKDMSWEAQPNPAASAGGGAGIQAAQFVLGRGVQAIISANVGPNALQVFLAAGVNVYACPEATVEEAVRGFVEGRLSSLGTATTPGHAGATLQAEETVESLESQAAALRAEIAALQQQTNSQQRTR